jgi:predicted transcriptional regulator
VLFDFVSRSDLEMRTESLRRVYDVLGFEPITFFEITRKSKASDSTIKRALNELIKFNLVSKVDIPKPKRYDGRGYGGIPRFGYRKTDGSGIDL